ncbi:MAG: hypothetical protein H7X70_02960 [Candidatus Kapabacteria bacterium]|nr:hypothetical protein [Candidatus Kapabacteria bacterium]
MTNQELLAGFLDRSLSEEHLLEFEALKNASPEFASEVREMLAVEELLTVAAPRVQYPIAFLATVESSIAAKVAAGATAAGLFTWLAHSVWTWVAGGTAAVVIGGGALYLASKNEATPSAPSKSMIKAAPRTSETPSIESNTPTVPELGPTRQPQLRNAAKPSAQSTNSSSSEMSVQITEATRVIVSLKADYEKCLESNDKVRCAQLALSLGSHLRKEEKNAEARKYLLAAVDHARTLKLAAFEMDAHGELGMLAKSEGDEQRAATSFRRAVEIGQSNNKNSSRWNSEIEKLERR